MCYLVSHDLNNQNKKQLGIEMFVKVALVIRLLVILLSVEIESCGSPHNSLSR